jgi:hypothetical protein
MPSASAIWDRRVRTIQLPMTAAVRADQFQSDLFEKAVLTFPWCSKPIFLPLLVRGARHRKPSLLSFEQIIFLLLSGIGSIQFPENI